MAEPDDIDSGRPTDNDDVKCEPKAEAKSADDDSVFPLPLHSFVDIKYGLKMLPVDCDQCGKTLSGYAKLKEHVKVVHDQIRDVFCDVCSKAFGTKQQLRQHQQRVHSTVRDFSCLVCDKGCVTKAELVTHMRCHTGERPFVCDTCSETFITNSDLTAHKRKHDGNMLTCDHCGKQFAALKHLNSHVKFVHLKVPNNRAERKRELKRRLGVRPKVWAKPEDKTCPECGRVFKKPSLMKRHMVSHLKNSHDLNVTDYYSESDCGSKVKCNECGREFAALKNLKEHVLNMHIREHDNKDEKNWQIIIDPYDGSQKKVFLPSEPKIKDLDITYYLTETDCGTRAKCNECGKEFSNVKNLKEHVLNIHLMRGRQKNLVNHSEEEVKFSTALTSEFSGKQLAQVLETVRSLKEAKTDKLERIMEAGKEGTYRAIFEDMGILETKTNVQSDPDDIEESKLEIKVDPKDFEESSLKEEDTDNVKQEPESQSGESDTEMNEIPFDEETDESDNYEPMSPAAICQERKSSEYDTKHDIKEKIEDLEKVHTSSQQAHDALKGTEETKTQKTDYTQESTKKRGRKYVATEAAKTCKVCRKVFNKLSKMKMHMVTHTKVYAALNIADKVFKSEDGRKGTCLECGKVFTKLNHMKPHIVQVHYQLHKTMDLDNIDADSLLPFDNRWDNVRATAFSGNNNSFQCEECGKSFTKKDVFKRHVLGHERPYVCSYCQKTFTRDVTLRDHINSIHMGLKEHKCPDCDVEYATSKALRIHVRTIHTHELPFICTECGAKFALGSQLKRHEYVHNPELRPPKKPSPKKNFECLQCDKNYNSKPALQQHVDVVHMGLKNHSCSYCGSAFGRLSTLHNHLLIHTGELPFKCSFCQQGFKEKRSMLRHVDQSHGTSLG